MTMHAALPFLSLLVTPSCWAWTSPSRPARPPTTSTALQAESTRRESFGELLGTSLLLPVMAGAEPANADDEYPFRVRVAVPFAC